MPSPTMHQYKLCYVKDNRAFFTTQDVTQQEGKYWEGDLGSPPYFYEEALREKVFVEMPYMIRSIVFYDGDITSFPSLLDLPVSVKEINEKAFPWLRTKVSGEYRFIFAGCSLAQVIQELERAGAKVYLQPHDYLEFVEAENTTKEQISKIEKSHNDAVTEETEKLSKRKPGRPKKK